MSYTVKLTHELDCDEDDCCGLSEYLVINITRNIGDDVLTWKIIDCKTYYDNMFKSLLEKINNDVNFVVSKGSGSHSYIEYSDNILTLCSSCYNTGYQASYLKLSKNSAIEVVTKIIEAYDNFHSQRE